MSKNIITTETFRSSNFTRTDFQYTEERGYGFVTESWFYPIRHVNTTKIHMTEKGIYVSSEASEIFWKNENDYNFGGLLFRRRTFPGTYRIRVTLTEDSAPAWIAVTGMRAEQIAKDFSWDPAGLVHKKSPANMEGNTWTYDYVSGNGILDIEIEPKSAEETTIGVEEIQIELLVPEHTKSEEKVTIFTLGDSTAQSFIFEEAIMSGWGQLFDDFFDLSKVNVINYSAGGRSVKNMYQEGRFNDLMLAAKPGDYLLLQSGHNDESRDELKGMDTRFGRGNDETTYTRWLEEVYIPAARVRGVNLIFVTSMTRIDSEKTGKTPVLAGFQYSENPGIHFPGIMKKIAAEHGIPVLDLYERSVEYVKQLGGEAAKAMFLSIEAGETPGKTNSGSYANGNPSGSCDGTHAKEALAKQWVRLILTEICMQKLKLAEYLKEEVHRAIEANEERILFPEISDDVQTGENAYYRNQIEKMIKMGILSHDDERKFYPKKEMGEEEFCCALEKLWNIRLSDKQKDSRKILTRERMACFILEAYETRFGKEKDGSWRKPVYMTDYNGVNLSPDSPYYDANLDGESAQYYPLVTWEHIEDKEEIKPEYKDTLKQVYELGLMRSEYQIQRGKMINGRRIEPKKTVTREKAAKELFFLSVLIRDKKEENDK